MKTKGAFISRWVDVLFLVLCISVLFSYSESAAQSIELKLGFVTAASEGDPYFITSKKFGELVESYTNGKYKVKLFPSGQLGNESEMIKNLTMGSMDLGVITNAPTGAFVKSFMVFDLPFIFPNEQVAHKVLDGEAGKMVLAKLDKLQIVGLAISEGGFRHMINNMRPVNTPEDTKGIKFRVMTTPIYIALFQSLGSKAVPLPWGEVFTAMQQKVVDGLEIPLSVIYATNLLGGQISLPDQPYVLSIDPHVLGTTMEEILLGREGDLQMIGPRGNHLCTQCGQGHQRGHPEKTQGSGDGYQRSVQQEALPGRSKADVQAIRGRDRQRRASGRPECKRCRIQIIVRS